MIEPAHFIFYMGLVIYRYSNMYADYTGQGFDQLLDVINKIKNNPDDHQIILSAWNPTDMLNEIRYGWSVWVQLCVEVLDHGTWNWVRVSDPDESMCFKCWIHLTTVFMSRKGDGKKFLFINKRNLFTVVNGVYKVP